MQLYMANSKIQYKSLVLILSLTFLASKFCMWLYKYVSQYMFSMVRMEKGKRNEPYLHIDHTSQALFIFYRM